MSDHIFEFLRYEPETGKFFWKKRSSPICRLNSEAGSLNSKGYITISFNKYAYKAHRLAWFFVYKSFPKYQIDHINGIKDDNRIENLRDVPTHTNNSNKIIHRNGKLPFCNFDNRLKSWVSEFKINNKRFYGGLFKTQKEAHQISVKMREAVFNNQDPLTIRKLSKPRKKELS